MRISLSSSVASVTLPAVPWWQGCGMVCQRAQAAPRRERRTSEHGSLERRAEEELGRHLLIQATIRSQHLRGRARVTAPAMRRGTGAPAHATAAL